MGRYTLRDKLILAGIAALFVWYYFLQGQTFGPRFYATLEGYLYLGIALVLAVTIHEFAHASVALLLGDRTAQMLGRVSLNPLRHLDLYGTLAFIFFQFGGGKPTPINPYNMRSVSPLVGAAITAIAGPTSNVVLAIIAAIALGQAEPYGDRAMLTFLHTLAIANILLAAFNFLPIPPLDGFSLARLVLPRNVSGFLEQYGFIILLALIFLPQFLGRQFDILGQIMGPLEVAIRSFVETASGVRL
jgi:Zn-dependent protease